MAQITKITSAARATTNPVVSPSFALPASAESVVARLIVTAAPGVPTGDLTLSVEEYDADTGQWSTVDSAAPVSAAGTVELGIDATTFTESVIRLAVEGSTAQSYTYSATFESIASASTGYGAPNLVEMRARVARDIADPDLEAFTSEQVDDFINDGIAELNQFRPREAFTSVTDTDQLTSLGMTYVWKVEVVDTASPFGSTVIPPQNDETKYANGWLLYAGTLRLPQRQITWLDDAFEASRVTLNVYGYAVRAPITDDSDVAEFDLQDEMLVRRYCQLRAFRVLIADRALFQQWQASANNSDVSPTQLTNMAQVAEAEWARTRARSLLIRRPAVGW